MQLTCIIIGEWLDALYIALLYFRVQWNTISDYSIMALCFTFASNVFQRKNCSNMVPPVDFHSTTVWFARSCICVCASASQASTLLVLT